MQAQRTAPEYPAVPAVPNPPTTVAEAMNTKVIALAPGDSLIEAVRILRRNRVSGCPVISPVGEVMGVLSESDVVRALDKNWLESRPLGLLELVLPESSWDRPGILKDLRERLARLRVAQAMTTDPAVVDVHATLGEAARLMLDRSVNRLPVIQNGHLVGILTRRDMIVGWPR